MDRTDLPAPCSLPARWWALHVGDDLDLATASGLDARIGRAMARRRDDGLVLDLAAVTFMDCSGLRPLLRARNRLQHRFCLRRVPPRVLRFLTLADLAASLRILPEQQLWPPEAEPRRCRTSLEDLFDHRPARPVGRLAGPSSARALTPAAIAGA